MPQYYKWLFPHEELVSWLAYGNDKSHPASDKSFLKRREWCFTLEGDIFVRYQSFSDAAALKESLVKK